MFKILKQIDAELLKYFKCTQKKDKLYTGTLPAQQAAIFLPLLLGSQIPTCAKCNRKHQVKDHKGHIFC